MADRPARSPLIPGPLELVVLVVAVYRLTRLVGWDHVSERLRARLTRPWDEPICPPCGVERADYERRGDGEWVGLEACPNCGSEERPVWIEGAARPRLAQFLACPFCVGFWLSLAAYGAWLSAPRLTLYAMTPLAISGAVGLIAKNLDE